MKKFKRFLCIPLLVLFALSMLTLPAAAAVKVVLPDGQPAASMTLTFKILRAPIANSPSVFGPVDVTTDAQGVFPYPDALKNLNFMGYLFLDTSTPSKMQGIKQEPISMKDALYDNSISVQLKAK